LTSLSTTCSSLVTVTAGSFEAIVAAAPVRTGAVVIVDEDTGGRGGGGVIGLRNDETDEVVNVGVDGARTNNGTDTAVCVDAVDVTGAGGGGKGSGGERFAAFGDVILSVVTDRTVGGGGGTGGLNPLPITVPVPLLFIYDVGLASDATPTRVGTNGTDGTPLARPVDDAADVAGGGGGRCRGGGICGV
jgi:hypothetical protein